MSIFIKNYLLVLLVSAAFITGVTIDSKDKEKQQQADQRIQDELVLSLNQTIDEYNSIIDKQEGEISKLKGHIDELAMLRPVLDILGPDEINLIVEFLQPSSPFDSDFRVTSRFGEGRGYQGAQRNGHRGNDLVPSGEWYLSSMWDGVVVDIGIDAYLGKYIIVEHAPNIRTLYAHLQTIFYSAVPGESVGPDKIMGVMGNTGNSDGAHLHLELQIFDGTHWVAVDIYPWLQGH